MQRKPVRHAVVPSYPVDTAALDRRGFLSILGAAAGAAALQGCIGVATAGAVGPDDGSTYVVDLPHGGALRSLAFAGQGSLDYRIRLVTTNYQFYTTVLNQMAAMLERTDDVLLSHPFGDFAEDADLRSVQQELTQVLADAYYGYANAPLYDVVSLTLTVTNRQTDPSRPL